MAFRIQVHIAGEDPVVLDVEELPDPSDNYVMGMNPQRRDGKPVDNILHEVDQVIYPWWRINFIQILPSEQEEIVETFVRD
jgi:hypothetical protein